MTSDIGVYRMQHILDDPRYYGLACKGLAEPIPRQRKNRSWKVIRLARIWKPSPVVGRIRPFVDCSTLNLFPVFNQRAVNALQDFLKPNGELLPVKISSGSYFAFNVTTVADVLDRRRSQIGWLEEPITVFNIARYEFTAQKLKGLSIFRLPEDPLTVYVTQPFVDRAREHRLRGMEFFKIWPFPANVKWWDVARAQAAQRSAEDLPPGRTITGESVFIEFSAKDHKTGATKAAEKAVAKMKEELDALLVDFDSDAPGVGYPEVCDFNTPGILRIKLSCPDASALYKALQPWLRKLKWPAGVRVIKRRGPYFEPKVRQSRIHIKRR